MLPNDSADGDTKIDLLAHNAETVAHTELGNMIANAEVSPQVDAISEVVKTGVETVEHTMLLIKETEVYNGTATGCGEVVEMLPELAANVEEQVNEHVDIGEIIGKQALASVETVEHTMLLIKETEVENTGDLFSSQLEDLKQEFKL